jgi:uncharacterized protein with GYD domain
VRDYALHIASYAGDELAGLLCERGTAAVEHIASIGKSLDTKPDDVMFAFGEDDVYVVWELPDNETAAPVSLAIAACPRAA